MEGKTFQTRADLDEYLAAIKEPYYIKTVRPNRRAYESSAVTAYVIPVSEVIEFLEIKTVKLLEALEFKEIEVKVTSEDKNILVSINVENNAILIGQRGYMLGYIQTLLQAYVFTKFRQHIEVNVDIANYWTRQKTYLSNLVNDLSKLVIARKKDYALKPTPANQRRFIYQVLEGVENIEVISEGVGKDRHILIKYTGPIEEEEMVVPEKRNEETTPHNVSKPETTKEQETEEVEQKPDPTADSKEEAIDEEERPTLKFSITEDDIEEEDN